MMENEKTLFRVLASILLNQELIMKALAKADNHTIDASILRTRIQETIGMRKKVIYPIAEISSSSQC